ncbi:MAG: hypothetical protein GW771_02870 [Flavobacteriia bacterium]|nr:hypothetical protein [Flavobacteriia bacterium]
MDIGSLAKGDIILYLVLLGVIVFPFPFKYTVFVLGKTNTESEKGPKKR